MPRYVIQHHLAHSSSKNIKNLAVSISLTQPIMRTFRNSLFPSSKAFWNSIPLDIQKNHHLKLFVKQK